MNPAVILGIIGAALALVPIVYELVLLTIDFIKKLKKKKDNKVIAMQLADVFAGIVRISPPGICPCAHASGPRRPPPE